MRGKVAYVNGYRYTAKDSGLLKEGMSITLETEEDLCDDDGKGNFKVGHPFEEIKLTKPFCITSKELIDLLGCEVDVIKDRRIGERYDSVVEIRKL